MLVWARTVRLAGLSQRRRAVVFSTVWGALLGVHALAAAPPADAGTSTFTGSVSSVSLEASWRFHFVTTTAPGELHVKLDWPSTTAQLSLSLYRKSGDGTNTWVGGQVGHHPEEATVPVGVGVWRIGVKAVQGASTYTVTATYPSGAPPPVPGPFLTLLFSRSQITVADNCVANNTGVARLDTVVAPELDRRGLHATGSVQTGDTSDNAHSCLHGRRSLGASWDELAWLRNTYDWDFVSHSSTYATAIASLNARQQWNETCGSMEVLKAHGHAGADGLFVWPNNKWDAGVQLNLVSRCFAFGRQYGPGITDRASALSAPHWQSTIGMSGGRCQDVSLPCSRLPTLTTYRAPQVMADKMASLRSDQWLTIQVYLLVTGSRAGLWDCTSPDWQEHWSSEAERYCWVDYLRVLNSIPANVETADPKTVAAAWGRTGFGPVPAR
ncbi:MAG: hypothetical protein QOJ13_901 [Gaiellales bacterium]|jgi:hypothetical protein|nr:hypothetical protein [Gaiellales bacterium]